MKKWIALLLAAATMLCLAACNDTPVPPDGKHNDVLDKLVAIRYRGESEKIRELAPQEYWDWYKSQGRSVEDLITYSTGAYNSWLSVMGSQYGENLTVGYDITGEKALDAETQAQYAAKLEEVYGIDADTVKDGKVLSVTFTITGSAMTDTIDSEFTMLTVGSKQYLVRAADDNGDFTVTFQFY